MKHILLSLLFLPALLSAAEELSSAEFGGYRNFHLRMAREFERELRQKYPDLNGGFLRDRLTFLTGNQAFGNGRNTNNEAITEYLSWNPDQKEDQYTLQLVATFEAIGIPFSPLIA